MLIKARYRGILLGMMLFAIIGLAITMFISVAQSVATGNMEVKESYFFYGIAFLTYSLTLYMWIGLILAEIKKLPQEENIHDDIVGKDLTC